MGSIKDKIIELRNDNKSYSEISKILNIRKSTISYHCAKLGLNNPVKHKDRKISIERSIEINNYYKTHTIEETSKNFNISRSTVTKYSEKKIISKPKKISFCLNCEKEVINKKYCSQKCKNEYEYNDRIKMWLSGSITGMKGKTSTSDWIKRYMIKKHGEKCMECGWDKINPYTNNIPIELEHIDGNFTNNKEENLKLLCPSCHSLTKTYKGANVGKGRPRTKYY